MHVVLSMSTRYVGSMRMRHLRVSRYRHPGRVRCMLTLVLYFEQVGFVLFLLIREWKRTPTWA